jgi:hypothetical protein
MSTSVIYQAGGPAEVEGFIKLIEKLTDCDLSLREAGRPSRKGFLK